MNSINDISLVAQVAVFHNKRAFDTLVRKYQEPVRRFFMNQTLGDSPLSDDLAQDTFVKAYINISSFRGMSGFSTWLFRIAYNVFYDYTRSKKYTEDVDNSSMAAAKSSGNEENGLKLDIYHALQGLKETERTCITLQLMEGETIDHISAITGIPPNTVKSHLSRGKEKLSTYLKQNGYDR